MGFSQESLSLKLGLSRGAVSQYESERNYPNIEAMVKLCEIFHVSLDELVLESTSYSSKSVNHALEESATYTKQQPQENTSYPIHLQKEIGYLTKTVAMQEREINTMRSYTARLEKELEKCEDTVKQTRQTG